MAKQLTNNFSYKGGYVDSIQSIKDFDALLSLPRSEKFVGLTTTVLNGVENSEGGYIPVDVWLSESRNSWVVKSIPPIDNLSQLDKIPEGLISKGFRVTLKSGEVYFYQGVDEYNKRQWVADISRDEFDETISDSIKTAIDEITSGASETFDTLKEIEEWIKSNSGETINAITKLEENVMWLPVELGDEKHVVRHWKGSREKYEYLVKNNAVSDWTRYIVIDSINGEDVITEYYGTNQITELTGQMLPVNSIITNISDITPKPYDRYLVGGDRDGYMVYEYVIDSQGKHRWLIKPFDYRFGIRVKDRGFKNYLYVNGELITYDEVDCGIF